MEHPTTSNNVNKGTPMPQKIDAILFDLDGTLLNSIDGIVESFRHTIDHFVPDHGLDSQAIIKMLGLPLMEQMRQIGQCPQKAEQMVDHYREHNYKIIPQMPLYDGVTKILEDLRAHYKLGVVTAKQRTSALMSITEHQLETKFEVIVTSSDTLRHKPDPEPLLYALDKINTKPQHCIYVGDATFDIQCAKAAGCLSIAALWGPNSRQHLAPEEPDFFAEDISELPVILNSL
jgi:pyrophosphatase PpaX